MNKKSILKVVIIIWLLLFLGFSILKVADPPIYCWDGWDYANNIPIGECKHNYISAILGLIPHFTVWAVILVIFFKIYRKNENKV